MKSVFYLTCILFCSNTEVIYLRNASEFLWLKKLVTLREIMEVTALGINWVHLRDKLHFSTTPSFQWENFSDYQKCTIELNIINM